MRMLVVVTACSTLAVVTMGIAGCNDRQPVGDATVGTKPARLSIDLAGHVTKLGPQRLPNDRFRVVTSPDGRWQAVVRTPAGNGGQGSVTLRRAMPDARGRVVERHLFGDPHDVRWSYDSRWLAMLAWSPHLLSAVTVGTDGSRRVLASPFCSAVEDGFAWDPRSSRIAVVVPLEKGTGCTQGVALRIVRPGGHGTVIARAIQGAPVWSADGRWIATSGAAVEVMHPDGSGRRLLGGGFVTWAPKGHVLAITGQDLSLGRPSGPLARLDADVLPGLPAQFSPDGSLVAYWRWNAIVVRGVADLRVVLDVPIGRDVRLSPPLRWSADSRSLLATAEVYRD